MIWNVVLDFVGRIDGGWFRVWGREDNEVNSRFCWGVLNRDNGDGWKGLGNFCVKGFGNCKCGVV